MREYIWGCPGNWSKKKYRGGGRDVEVDNDRIIQGSCGVTQGKILGGSKKGVTYTTPEERTGYRNLERIHVFPFILGRDSENKNGHAWLCATIDACNWWKRCVRVGVICVSKTTLVMAFWKIVVWEVGMILRKPEIAWLQTIRSGIYNSVKYGLKGMRHKNYNMYVGRK